MSQFYYSNGSRSPPYNDSRSTISKGRHDGVVIPSSEVADQLPNCFSHRGVVYDWSGNEIGTQFPPGKTPPSLTDEEIRVMYSEIWSPLVY